MFSKETTSTFSRIFKMPSLLRLNSVGEISSSSFTCDSADENRSCNVIKSGPQSISSYTMPLPKMQAVTSVPRSVSSPSKLGLIVFKPLYRSMHKQVTKANSFPGSVLSEFSGEPAQINRIVPGYNNMNKLYKKQLFSHNSVPSQCGNMEKCVLCASSSSPAFSMMGLTQTPTPNVLRRCCSAISDCFAFTNCEMYSASAENECDHSPLFKIGKCEANLKVASPDTVSEDETTCKNIQVSLPSPPEDILSMPDSSLLQQAVKLTCDCKHKSSISFTTECKCNGLEENIKPIDYSFQSDTGGIIRVDTDIMQKLVETQENNVSDANSVGSLISLFKPVDHTSVLFERRKCTKKGRPSAKKQKKRRREKLKQSEKLSESEPLVIVSDTFDDFRDVDESDTSCQNRLHLTICNDFDRILDVQLSHQGDITSSSVKESNNTTSHVPIPSSMVINHPSVSCFFISGIENDSQTENSNMDESEWSESECEQALNSHSISMNKNLGFGIALSLDAIFKKQDVPSPNVQQNTKDSNYNCIEFLTSEAADEPTLSEGQSIFLREINAKWDDHYLSAGFGSRSCNSTDNTYISMNPIIQVHFADDSQLETVHEVGTEERRGKWMNFAVDRERFSHRIQEVKGILANVLDNKHREKVLQRNTERAKGRGFDPRSIQAC